MFYRRYITKAQSFKKWPRKRPGGREIGHGDTMMGKLADSPREKGSDKIMARKYKVASRACDDGYTLSYTRLQHVCLQIISYQ